MGFRSSRWNLSLLGFGSALELDTRACSALLGRSPIKSCTKANRTGLVKLTHWMLSRAGSLFPVALKHRVEQMESTRTHMYKKEQ